MKYSGFEKKGAWKDRGEEAMVCREPNETREGLKHPALSRTKTKK